VDKLRQFTGKIIVLIVITVIGILLRVYSLVIKLIDISNTGGKNGENASFSWVCWNFDG